VRQAAGKITCCAIRNQHCGGVIIKPQQDVWIDHIGGDDGCAFDLRVYLWRVRGCLLIYRMLKIMHGEGR